MQVGKAFKYLYEAYNSGRNYRGYVLPGGSRSGKSYGIIQFIIVLCQNNKNKKLDILIARQQYSDLKKTIIKDFFKVLAMYGMYNEKNHYKSNPQSYNLFGNMIYFTGLDAGGLHGEAHDIVWINEAFESEKDSFDQLKMRLNKFFIFDYNPCYTEHWILDSVNKRPDVYVAPTTTQLDNPWLPKEIRDEIMAYDPSNPANIENGTADDYMWKVYGLGIGAQPEGVIFPYVTWIDEFPKGLTHWFGEDYGYTNDPTAIVKVAIDGNNLYLEEKFYEPTETAIMLNEAMRSIGIEKHLPIYADSSDKFTSQKYGIQEMVKELKTYGWNIEKTSKKGRKIDWIAELKKYRIHIVSTVKIGNDVRVSNFRKEQQNYRWKSINGLQINDPIDKYDHLWTATFYAVVLKGKRRSRMWN